jgi:hypothetical protein
LGFLSDVPWPQDLAHIDTEPPIRTDQFKAYMTAPLERYLAGAESTN